jgi:hypothetical protein
MAVQYDWIINKLITIPSDNGLENIVKEIDYGYTAFEEFNGKFAQVTVYDILKCPAPSTDAFVEYAGLSEEVIISWIESLINIEELKEKALELLDKRKIEIASKPKMPW